MKLLETTNPTVTNIMHLLTNHTAPEAPFAAVVRGDFSGLSTPILVAAYSEKQFEQFVYQNGLLCSEVRRFQGYQARLTEWPENKVLLLLPGWSQCSRAAEAVLHWVNVQDRHTCQLTGPKPHIYGSKSKARPRLLKIASVAAIIAAIHYFAS